MGHDESPFVRMIAEAIKNNDFAGALRCTQVANEVFRGRVEQARNLLANVNIDDLTKLHMTFVVAAQVVQCAMDGREVELPPEVWQEMPWCEIRVVDPDGWRSPWKGEGPKNWDVPITKEEFLGRAHGMSTLERKHKK